MVATIKASVIQENSSSVANLTLDSSGNVTAGNNLTVTGAVTSSGLVTGATGALYPIVNGTAVASTSGTSIDFTGIPSWTKRITLVFNNVTLSAISNTYIVQLGSSSFSTTGYSSQIWTNTGGFGAVTSGLSIATNGSSITYAVSGAATLILVNSNNWVSSSQFGFTNVTSGGYAGAGSAPSLGGALDRIRITTVAGTATFTAGTINIQYE